MVWTSSRQRLTPALQQRWKDWCSWSPQHFGLLFYDWRRKGYRFRSWWWLRVKIIGIFSSLLYDEQNLMFCSWERINHDCRLWKLIIFVGHVSIWWKRLVFACIAIIYVTELQNMPQGACTQQKKHYWVISSRFIPRLVKSSLVWNK